MTGITIAMRELDELVSATRAVLAEYEPYSAFVPEAIVRLRHAVRDWDIAQHSRPKAKVYDGDKRDGEGGHWCRGTDKIIDEKGKWWVKCEVCGGLYEYNKDKPISVGPFTPNREDSADDQTGTAST